MHSYTIYRHATRSARSAVSRALCSYRYSLPAACKTCEIAQLSQTVAVLPATPAHSTARAGNPGFLCILHKNKRQKLRNSVQNFIEMWFFGFRPQYIVDFDPFYPIKSPASCVFTQVAFGSNPCYHMLENKGKGAATGGAARPASPPPRRAAKHESACTLPSKQRPVKAAHLHSKRTAPLTAGGSYKPAQHSAHTTANTHRKRISKSSVAYEGQVER